MVVLPSFVFMSFHLSERTSAKDRYVNTLNMKACLTCGLDITGHGVFIKTFISSTVRNFFNGRSLVMRP